MRRILKEDITSGSVIVYHRTGKGVNNPVKGIAADGYRVGEGNTYGAGVYTTYNLESQLTNYHRKTYGPIIIESKVLSMKDFLIFDYDVAKIIYGNKNYTLDKQLQIILGKELNNYKDDDNLKSLISKLNDIEYNSNIAEDFYKNYSDIILKLRGIVFTGRSDGNVLVSYDRKNIEPIRYTEDEGKTWKNVINRDIYKRTKGYDTDKSLEYEHILNKLDIGGKFNNKETEILLNNKELISRLDNDGIRSLLYYSSEPEKIINVLSNKGKDYISRLDSVGISRLLYKSSEPENVINLLLNNKELISRLDNNGIGHLLDYSKEREKVINSLLNNKELISRLDNNGINNLLEYSSEPEQIKQIIKKYRPDLKLESKINIKRIIQEEINKFIRL